MTINGANPCAASLLVFLLLLPLHAAHSEPLWQTLPPISGPCPAASIPVAPRSMASASITRRSAAVRRLSCCTVASLTRTIGAIKSRLSLYTTHVMDSRGHGRSARDPRPYGYDIMADDVVALLDTLNRQGRRGGLERRRHPRPRPRHSSPRPRRQGVRLAANTVTSGMKEGVEKNPTFAGFIERAGHNTPNCPRPEGLRCLRRADQQDVGDRAELD